MRALLNGTRAWQTWLTNAVEDDHTALNPAVMTGLKPGNRVSAQSIAVNAARAIALRMFGQDTNNDTATIDLVGWMGAKKFTSGPGQVLWSGQVILGANTASIIPNADGRWGAAATWFEVDTFDSSGGHNLAAAVIRAFDGSAIILLPTLGYSHIQMTVTDIGGSSPEMTKLNGLWRPISEGDVI